MLKNIKEKEKYEKVWSEIPSYGHYSPAMLSAEPIVNMCNKLNLTTILDAGCGSGKATEQFMDAGLEVTAVDITDNCIQDRARRKHIAPFFTQTPLSELSMFNNDCFDMVFCVDVMEHIPPVALDATIKELARVCGKYAYFQISLFRDGFGVTIGETLHLSLFSAREWGFKLGRHFGGVTELAATTASVGLLCEKSGGN